MPLGLLLNRNRGGAYLTILLLAIGPMGSFYVITLYLQQVRGFSPLQTEAAWLPFALGIVVGAGNAPKPLVRATPRHVAAVGALVAAGAALWASTIGVDTVYWLHVAPAMFLLAVGFGLGVLALTRRRSTASPRLRLGSLHPAEHGSAARCRTGSGGPRRSGCHGHRTLCRYGRQQGERTDRRIWNGAHGRSGTAGGRCGGRLLHAEQSLDEHSGGRRGGVEDRRGVSLTG